MKNPLDNYSSAELMMEIRRREEEETYADVTNLPTDIYEYCEEKFEIKSDSLESNVRYFTVFVDDGAEGVALLAKVYLSDKTSLIDECDEKLEDTIKHYYVSWCLENDVDPYHEQIIIDDISRYGITPLLIKTN